MKAVSWIMALTLAVGAHAQKVITVRAQHSKVLINTLRANENIVRGETRLLIKTDGERYEYLTGEGQTYRHYENDRLLQTLPYARFDRPKYYTWAKYENAKYMTYGKIGQKEIGPYQQLHFLTSGINADQALHGYYYTENDRSTFIDRETGKTYGPYDAISWPKVSREHLLFSYRKGNGWWVVDRKGTYGPYDSVVPLYASTQPEGLAYTYKQKGVWRVHCKAEITKTFTLKPSLQFAEDGSWEVCGVATQSDGKQHIFLQDGTVYDQHQEIQTIRFPGLPVLIAKGHARITYPEFDCQFDYSESYTIQRGEEVLGEFYIERLYGKLIGKSDKIYPLVLYKKNPEGISTSRKEFYLLHAEKGLTSPIPGDARYKLSVGGDTWAYLGGTERFLFLNGEQQSWSNVNMVDVSASPKNWYMAVKEGNYVNLYRNGKADASAETADKFATYNYPTRNKPFVVVTENDKSYAKTPHSSKLYGPVNPRSIIAFSKNNTHYAEGDERSAQILIDGKVIGKGYGLVYNEDKNAYHWVSQEGQKLYLHTYELD
ncbi:MAG: FHA domain-containing protein [Bacteroidota bacterium]